MSQVELANLSNVAGKTDTNSVTLSSRALDYFEKLVLIGMFSYFLIPVVSAIIVRSDLPSLLICISETLVVAMVCVRRRARTMSHRKIDWLLALSATTIPMLVRPTEYSILPTREWPILLMLGGMAIQIFAKVNLGRRFGAVPANRGICHRGLYRIVRHPIYAGYMLTHIGFLLAASSWWNLGVYMLLYSIVVPRILAEERLLSEDRDYVTYCKRVPNRLIPGVF